MVNWIDKIYSQKISVRQVVFINFLLIGSFYFLASGRYYTEEMLEQYKEDLLVFRTWEQDTLPFFWDADVFLENERKGAIEQAEYLRRKAEREAAEKERREAADRRKREAAEAQRKANEAAKAKQAQLLAKKNSTIESEIRNLLIRSSKKCEDGFSYIWFGSIDEPTIFKFKNFEIERVTEKAIQSNITKLLLEIKPDNKRVGQRASIYVNNEMNPTSTTDFDEDFRVPSDYTCEDINAQK